ncbi:trefoil factor 3 [Tenrec ecaudatus]|uniref:trefoil factor 3 n=1 Tax=Tenrec ecaudatus TaxID=94439 RepID=UPI003F591699
MEARALWLLAVVLAGALCSSTGEFVGLSANQCAVPAKDRVDCGYPEVTAEQCNNRGCCFDSSIPAVPWCFKPLQETDVNIRPGNALPPLLSRVSWVPIPLFLPHPPSWSPELRNKEPCSAEGASAA